jgi:succinoglycan biosynthesis transport protein ExoP
MERRKINRATNQAFDAGIIDVRDVVHEVWKRRVLVAAMITVPTVIAGLYIYTRPPVYISTASVMFEDSSSTIANMEEVLPGMKFDNNTSATEANVLKSPTLVRGVIAKQGLHIDSAGNLVAKPVDAENNAAMTLAQEKESAAEYAVLSRYMSGLVVEPIRGSRVIDIKFKSFNPYLSAQLANAHAEQYIESRVDLKKDQAVQLNSWIAEQVEQLKKQSAEKSLAVQKFRRENGMVKGRNAEELVNQQVSDIASQLIPVQARRADLEAQADAIAKGNMQAAIQGSSVIQSLKTQASAARQELQGLGSKYGENHPLYVESLNRVNQIDADIARETGVIRQAVTSALKTVTEQEKLLNAQLDAIKGTSDEQRQKQIELEGLELEAAASVKLLDSFIARYEEVSSQTNFASPDARIVANAEIPMAPVGGKKLLKMLVVIFLSTLLACTVAYLLKFIDNGLRSVVDIRRGLQLRFLGAVPAVRNPIAEVTSGRRSSYLEEIKRIQLHLANKPNVKTLMITAAETGEGKTSLTLALAAHLTSIGRKVLVVDADLHAPDVARISGVIEGMGLVDVLAGKVIASSAITRDERGVAILQAGGGHISANLLTSDSLRAMLDTLKDNYDYILIDASPVLNSSDAETVAAITDMVVLVVAYGHTSRAKLKKAADTLRQFAQEVPYVILNKADLKNIA